MLKKMLIVLILSVWVLAAGCATNPVTGKNQLMLVGQDWELQVGRQYSPEVQKQLGGEIANWQLQNYVTSVGQKIAMVSHLPELEFHFVAVNDESVNAMALPGGYVFVTRGMLEQLTSEAQLAGVLAHETAHITARHSASAVSNQIGIDLVLSAAGQKASSGTMDIARMGAGLIGLSYNRTQERQADTIGLEYMVKAGYSPYGMVETIEILQQQNAVRPIELFSSHPNPANRKADIIEHMSGTSYPPGLTTGHADYQKLVLQNLNN
ncbi:MAG: M48 family metalloprotease [Planctomycetes bacterium]|nr:M48 family metalloprotease [Planctomycetota bacterium]